MHYKEKAASRDVAVPEHLFATGARVSEVCSLTPNDVNITDHTLYSKAVGTQFNYYHTNLHSCCNDQAKGNSIRKASKK